MPGPKGRAMGWLIQEPEGPCSLRAEAEVAVGQELRGGYLYFVFTAHYAIILCNI
jgi:hypothetical protein